MATAPQSASAQPMPSGDDQDPSLGAGGAPDDDSQGDGSYVIEIRVSADKQISVCVESGAEEGQEESGGGAADAGDYAGGTGGADDDSVPVKSIKEALTLALEVFRNDGQLPQQADEDFQQGFKGANT